MKNIAIVLAGGNGSRMNSNIPKQYMEIAGKTILHYSLQQFEESPFIDEIILVTGKEDVDYCKDTYRMSKISHIVEGGKERYALDHFRRRDADGAQQRLQDMGERRLADPAQAQRGQGDTQLAGRQVGVELVMHGAQDLPAPAVVFGYRLNPGGAQFDHGKFGRNEKTVEQNQDQSKKNHAEVGEECREGQARGRVHDGVLRVPSLQIGRYGQTM